MNIVQKIYEENIDISEIELADEIVKHEKLDILDLWLLPQYPFDKWRQKYDYPRLLSNIKSRQNDFETWMKEQNLTDEDLTNGYLSDFLENKPLSKDKTRFLIEVSYKGKVRNQVWHNYDGEKSSAGDEESVLYNFKKSFISYYDWKLNKGEKFSFVDTFHRFNPNTEHEQVYLNHNIPLLKMGGIEPPRNSIGMLFRGKKLEFVNASGLELKGTIYFGDMGNLSFNHCTVDNLKCSELDMPLLDFENCSVKNLQVRNSEIRQWDFITSDTTGNIIDSKIIHARIFGGQFSPTFTNSEVVNPSVQHKQIVHDFEFEKTYRALARSAIDAGNKILYTSLKTAELDFIRSKSKGLKKLFMLLDKLYWGYGLKPKRLIIITLIAILLFAVIYSFFPEYYSNGSFACSSYITRLENSIYYSGVTFTILGYSDMNPTGFIRILAVIEALFGAFTMGFLIAGLTNRK